LKGRRVCLIGGAGFIGHQLTRDLLRSGAEVAILDLVRPVANDTAWKWCDIRLPNLGGAELSSGFDTVIFLASLLGKQCQEDPRDGWATNMRGALNVCEALTTAASPDLNLIYLSSAQVYTPGRSSPIVEDSPRGGTTQYGRGKIVGEQLFSERASSLGWDVTILRPFTVYGPGPASGVRGHFIAGWIESACARRPLQIYGDGRQCVDLVHVEDLGAMVLAALAAPRQRSRVRTYNAGFGEEVTVADLANWFGNSLPGVQFVHRFDVPAYGAYASIQRAKEELGWSPSISPRKGISSLLQSLQI